MRRRLLIAALLVLAGCGGSSGPAASTTAITPSTTLAVSTTAAPPACAVADLVPGVAVDVAAVTGDVDGDGSDDVLTSYRVPGDPPTWRLRVELAAGGSVDVAMEGDVLAAHRVLGVSDLDGDGTSEVFAQVGQGAYTVLIGMWSLVGCDLETVMLGAVPAVFPAGASVANVVGLSCPPGDGLVETVLQSSDGVSYAGVAITYRLDGTGLIEVAEVAVAATVEQTDQLSGFRCGEMSLG